MTLMLIFVASQLTVWPLVAAGVKEDNYDMLSSDKDHDSKCTYYNKICPNYSSLGKCRDQKAMEKEYLEAAVVNMYKAVLSKAANGDGCVMIRPPTMTYRSQRRRQDSFMMCDFTNPLNNELFSVWLSKVEVVNVSIDNQPNAITSAIRNILINST